MRREGEGWRLYRGHTPVARGGGGDRPPLSPAGGATGLPAALVGRAHWSPEGGRQAPPFFSPGTSLQIWREKKYTLGLSPYGRATGVYFWNFPKQTYIFEILIFLNIKKKKPLDLISRVLGPWPRASPLFVVADDGKRKERKRTEAARRDVAQLACWHLWAGESKETVAGGRSDHADRKDPCFWQHHSWVRHRSHRRSLERINFRKLFRDSESRYLGQMMS